MAQAERRHLTTRDKLLALLARYPARPGTPKLRELLNAPGKPALARSEAEERFLRLVRRSGVPAPEVNIALHGYELDFYWRDEGLAVELDGYAFHGDRDSFEADRRRDSGLAARGAAGDPRHLAAARGRARGDAGAAGRALAERARSR